VAVLPHMPECSAGSEGLQRPPPAGTWGGDSAGERHPSLPSRTGIGNSMGRQLPPAVEWAGAGRTPQGGLRAPSSFKSVSGASPQRQSGTFSPAFQGSSPCSSGDSGPCDGARRSSDARSACPPDRQHSSQLCVGI